MKKIIKISLKLVSLLFTAALGISYLSVFISPEKFWIPAFFGLAFPLLFIINTFFAILWIFRKHKILFITNLLFIIIGFSYITDYFQINFTKENLDKNQNSIKVMSYNVKLFNLYNWKENKNIRNKIFDILKKENADIVCFQEFYKENKKRFKTLDTLLNLQDAKYYHEEYTKIQNNKYFFGIATFCKYPIINKGKFVFKNSDNICIYTDVLIGNDTVRIYNNHLESIRFDRHDYNFIDSIQLKIDDKRIKGVKTISKRLKEAFIKRAAQVDTISKHVERCKYPVILCGDFNDTPISYAYHKLSKNLTDAFKESGSGFGRTYIGKFPSFRIDYIFYSNKMQSTSFKVINKDFSDHYPIVCNLVFTKEQINKP